VLKIYGRIYDSMVSWYGQSFAVSSRVHTIAALTMSSMAFCNVCSAAVLCAHWQIGWALRLVAPPQHTDAALLGAGLITAHWLYSRWRQRIGSPRSSTNAAQSRPWVAGAHMLVTISITFYASGLLASIH
jgi:hypothetical protein